MWIWKVSYFRNNLLKYLFDEKYYYVSLKKLRENVKERKWRKKIEEKKKIKENIKYVQI